MTITSSRPMIAGTKKLIERTIKDQRNIIEKQESFDPTGKVLEAEEYTVYKKQNQYKMQLLQIMHETKSGLITIYVDKKPVATTHKNYAGQSAGQMNDNDIIDLFVAMVGEYNERKQAESSVVSISGSKEEQEINNFLFKQLQNNR